MKTVTRTPATLRPARLAPVHPGDVLREEFMIPLGLSAYAVAKALAVAPITVSLLIRSKRNVSPEMALRLAAWSGSSAAFWINLQAQYDREIAESSSLSRILAEVSPLRRAA
jgi:addiction module HigA family antidote